MASIDCMIVVALSELLNVPLVTFFGGAPFDVFVVALPSCTNFLYSQFGEGHNDPDHGDFDKL
jgi:hypothetical protein